MIWHHPLGMKVCLSIAVVLLASLAVASQTTTEPAPSEKVRTVVSPVVGRSERVDVLLKDL